MRLGIDLGTTRTVVAVEDRGNFPVVGFVGDDGDLCDHYPSVTAEVGGVLVHGLDALTAARAGAPSLQSWKRLFADHPGTAPIRVGEVSLPLADLCADFLAALRRDLFTRSNLPKRLADPLEAAISVPANAHSTQRFVTMDAFRRAGFIVRAVLNEPSAAGVEYAHRYKDTLNSRREHVIVYDLGGGTFDAAVVRIAGGQHDVLATSGVARLGGDDFDEALLEMALEAAPPGRELTAEERVSLLYECRAAKEGLNPNSRRIALDLAGLGADAPASPVAIAVPDYYERVRPLVARTLEALEPLMGAEREGDEGTGGQSAAVSGSELAGIYVVGGASGLPVVPRILRERFGRRVHRSPYPSAATAIGLAIAAEDEDAPVVRERFTRHLGVFRERDGGARVSFDSIFDKGTPMPPLGAPPLTTVRTYRPAHNLGHFRFVECGALDAAGDPTGDITPYAEIRFPFDPRLRGPVELDSVPIGHLRGEGPLVEERYEVDPSGVVTITITDLDHGFARQTILCR
jgi:molecular chaperone DnaK (HSP70)